MARWSTGKSPGSIHQDAPDPSNIEHNTCDQQSKKRSASATVCDAICKRWRVRCQAPSTVSIKDFFAGRIYIHTDAYHIMTKLSSNSETVHRHDNLEYETVFTYHPAPWLLRSCFRFGFNALVMKAAQGWQHHIGTFRAVPNDSLIFEFCEKGNLDDVKSLLVRRDASPWDVNSEGWSPLHVSHPEVLPLFIAQLSLFMSIAIL